MASVSTSKSNGTRRILFGSGSNRRCLYLGHVSLSDARTIGKYVESLRTARHTQMLDPAAAAWVASLGDEFHEKLADLGLVSSRKRTKFTLADLIGEFESSKSVKPSTVAAYKQGTKSLLGVFGGECLLSSITPLEAEKWRKGLAEQAIAQATASKRTQVAKQLFGRAVKWGMIASNPFDGIRAGSQTNAKRGYYVPVETIMRAIDKCPDVEWRAILGLCRFAGLRCPSEVVLLKWTDVHFDRSRIIVTCEKTSHHSGKELREVPITPELESILMEAYEAAPVKTDFVITRYRVGNANLRTQFHRILERAGIAPWPRTFQNLRASFETDLIAQQNPIQAVAAWLGHSPQVAVRHYLTVRDIDFARVTKKVYEYDAREPKMPVKNATQHYVAQTSANAKSPSHPPEPQAVMLDKKTPCTFVQGVESGRNRARTCDLGYVTAAL